MAKRFILLTVIAVFFGLQTSSQPLSENAEVSVLTCGPGDDLYATFGHTAIQIYDPHTGVDRVYNYGTFDFDTPNFYLKFARGKLLYSLQVTSFERFMYVYHLEGRWVKRQVLNLNSEEKQNLYNFLETNALPQNRDYKYDFFYDNCSTRPRDVLEEVLGDKLVYNNISTDSLQTFRELIDLYLVNHPWSDLGIDFALGAPCDRIANRRQEMFLPDYLMYNLEVAQIQRNGMKSPLVSKTTEILKEKRTPEKASNILWLFWVLFGFCILTAFFIHPKHLRWFDIAFFLTAGLLGVVIALLWFATDHSATKWNFNLFWALPTWIWIAFMLMRKKPKYKVFKIHGIIMFAFLIFWIAIPQNLHAAVVPIALALGVRSWSWQISKFQSQ